MFRDNLAKKAIQTYVEAVRLSKLKARQHRKPVEFTPYPQEFEIELDIDEMVQIEIRFGNLDYELVWALQVDPLIDRQRTPQSRASIRIVFGTLKDLSAKKPEGWKL